ncbi:hypothetical protein BH23ACI1_BH23ACI1_32220 [soil metagenome]|nr:hypothetical protein [Acidobacteriota bacterium]
MTFTCSLILAAAMTTAAPNAADAAPASGRLNLALTTLEPASQVPLTDRRTITPQPNPLTQARFDRRPAALPAMYATLGALQALDIYSTRQALGAGAHEANPLMGKAAGNTGAMLAVKALSTAGTIYFVERAWKKNRKGAIITLAIINGATATIAAHNLRNARR